MAQQSTFTDKIVNADKLFVRHASNNYKFSPSLTVDDIAFYLLFSGKRKFDTESLIKTFENNTFGVMDSLKTLEEMGIITKVDDKNWQLDTAKILKKDEDGLRFVYPTQIKS